MGEYKLSVPLHTSALIVLLGMALRASHNQICVHQIMCVSWNTRSWNINLRHVYGMIRYPQELECTFCENILPNKRKHLTKNSWRNCVFTFFSKGFHPNTFRDIIIKSFNWIITKWRTQCNLCSWAIQHKSPLNIQYNNFELTTTKCIIFTTSPDHIN